MLTERGVHVHATPRNMDWDGQLMQVQLRSVNIPFSGVPNSRDISMIDMAVCDTGL